MMLLLDPDKVPTLDLDELHALGLNVQEDNEAIPTQEHPCFCGKEVSLQAISGGGHALGYLGEVTLKIKGQYVRYVKAAYQPEPDNTREYSPLTETFSPLSKQGILIDRMGSRVHSAFAFAVNRHNAVNQKRKYTGVPYWHHPLAVYESLTKFSHLLMDYYNSSSVLDSMYCAALLHDVAEDTLVEGETRESVYAIIGDLFGAMTMELVQDLTDGEFEGNRASRKAQEVARWQNCSELSKYIKLLDLADNTKDIAENDPDFAITYLPEKRRLLGVLQVPVCEIYAFSYEICEAAQKKTDEAMLQRALKKATSLTD